MCVNCHVGIACRALIRNASQDQHTCISGQVIRRELITDLVVGVYMCVGVCTGVYGCVQVCTGVYKCVQVCTGVYSCVQVDAGVYGCKGVHLILFIYFYISENEVIFLHDLLYFSLDLS